MARYTSKQLLCSEQASSTTYYYCDMVGPQPQSKRDNQSWMKPFGNVSWNKPFLPVSYWSRVFSHRNRKLIGMLPLWETEDRHRNHFTNTLLGSGRYYGRQSLVGGSWVTRSMSLKGICLCFLIPMLWAVLLCHSPAFMESHLWKHELNRYSRLLSAAFLRYFVKVAWVTDTLYSPLVNQCVLRNYYRPNTSNSIVRREEELCPHRSYTQLKNI